MVRQSCKPGKEGMDVQVVLCKWACTRLGYEMDLGGHMGLPKNEDNDKKKT